MSDQEKENKVFSQEVNRDDLKAAKGGTYDRDTCRNPAIMTAFNSFTAKSMAARASPTAPTPWRTEATANTPTPAIAKRCFIGG